MKLIEQNQYSQKLINVIGTPDIIADVFDTLIVQDIRQKYKSRNMLLMDRLAYYLMDNVSNLTSARNITNTFSSLKEKANHVTASAYMQYLYNGVCFLQNKPI